MPNELEQAQIDAALDIADAGIWLRDKNGKLILNPAFNVIRLPSLDSGLMDRVDFMHAVIKILAKAYRESEERLQQARWNAMGEDL